MRTLFAALAFTLTLYYFYDKPRQGEHRVWPKNDTRTSYFPVIMCCMMYNYPI